LRHHNTEKAFFKKNRQEVASTGVVTVVRVARDGEHKIAPDDGKLRKIKASLLEGTIFILYYEDQIAIGGGVVAALVVLVAFLRHDEVERRLGAPGRKISGVLLPYRKPRGMGRIS